MCVVISCRICALAPVRGCDRQGWASRRGEGWPLSCDHVASAVAPQGTRGSLCSRQVEAAQGQVWTGDLLREGGADALESMGSLKKRVRAEVAFWRSCHCHPGMPLGAGQVWL